MARTIADALMAGAGAIRPIATSASGRNARCSPAMEVPSPAGVDEDIAGVPCRVFRPIEPPKAVYLHFHGGAMILGSPLMNDVSNADLAERLGLAVVSVDYRLAPEHPFPAGSDDCLAVAAWLVEHAEAWFGTGDLLVGGESAGGYFAALTLLRIRDELGAIDRVRGANLVFGVYDLGGTPATHGFRPSDTPDILDLDTFAFVHECYLPGRTRDEARVPEISPLYADLQRPPARALHRRQRRPPPRRQPVHGGPVGGVRQRGGARGVSRLRARLHRRSPWSWRSGRTSGSTTSSCERLG